MQVTEKAIILELHLIALRSLLDRGAITRREHDDAVADSRAKIMQAPTADEDAAADAA